MVPPLPIPNREVKHVSAYDTSQYWENGSSPEDLRAQKPHLLTHLQFYIDLTPDYIKDGEFIVIKSFIPQLQPFYLIEDFPCLEEKRFRKFSNPKKEFKINDYPHPFL